jgi:7-carboxy-7-deazaguanine synthase
VKINEIFYSIQGESSFAGLPCAFVRLSACDLRCTWCDTAYAFHEGREMQVAEILSAIGLWPVRLALVTGGEPLLQREVHDLFRALLDRGYHVCVETGGHLPIDDVDPRVHRIVDLKCPSSGMTHRNRYANISRLTALDEVKFVVADRADFDWACGTAREHNLPARVRHILISPVHGRLPLDQLAQWVLDCGLPVRLQLQLHKFIWPGVERGV